MSRRIRFLITTSTLLLIVFLAACGGAETAEPDAKPAATEAAAPTEAAPAEAPTEEPTTAPAPTAVPPTEAPAEPTAEATAEVPAAEGEPDALSAILSAQGAFVGSDSIRASMESTDPSTGDVFTTTVEFVPPDRYRIVNAFTQMVSVANKTYMSADGSSWQELPIGLADVMQGLPTLTSDPEEIQAFLDDLQVRITNAAYTGKEDLNGMEMEVYEYDATSALDEPGAEPSHTTLWINPNDGRVYKVVTQTSAAGTTGTVTLLYEYDLPLEIEAPVSNQ